MSLGQTTIASGRLPQIKNSSPMLKYHHKIKELWSGTETCLPLDGFSPRK